MRENTPVTEREKLMAFSRRIEPGPAQESVWDYPRPPRLEPSSALIRVEFSGVLIASTTSAWRVLETSQPPTYYLPRSDISSDVLREAAGQSFCEWKGVASYLDIVVGSAASASAAWYYPNPNLEFAPLKDHVAFYPRRVDSCWVGEELVEQNDGDFYGGWITSQVVGPFKGGAGTSGW